MPFCSLTLPTLPLRSTLAGGFESLEDGEQFCITREGSSVQGVKLGRSLSSGGSPVPSASPTASPPRLQTPRGCVTPPVARAVAVASSRLLPSRAVLGHRLLPSCRRIALTRA